MIYCIQFFFFYRKCFVQIHHFQKNLITLQIVFPPALALPPEVFWCIRASDERSHHLFFLRLTHGLLAIIGAVHLHVILFQAEPDSFYDQLLIIYNEHLCHGTIPHLPLNRNIVFYLLKSGILDPGHLLNILYPLKITMFFPISDDIPGSGFPDSS